MTFQTGDIIQCDFRQDPWKFRVLRNGVEVQSESSGLKPQPGYTFGPDGRVFGYWEVTKVFPMQSPVSCNFSPDSVPTGFIRWA